MESNDSPEIPDRGKTSDIPGLHSGAIVKRRKLQWYVRLPFIRSAKAILLGTVKGGRRQGRQRKRWEDNIREWTEAMKIKKYYMNA